MPDLTCGACQKCLANVPAHPGSPLTLPMTRMILCPECGNKRCPKASDHDLACTGSNESGQPGSIYGPPPKGPFPTPDEFFAALHLTNERVLRHEAETPMRGHDEDGECCRRAAEPARDAHDYWASVCTCGMGEQERTGHYPEHEPWCEVPSPLDEEDA